MTERDIHAKSLATDQCVEPMKSAVLTVLSEKRGRNSYAKTHLPWSWQCSW